MKAKSNDIPFQSKNIIRIAIAVGLILLIPLILTIRDGAVEGGGWNWTLSDFIVMGTLLFGTGLAIDLAARKLTNPIYRIIAITAIIIALFLIWVELAVEGVSQAIKMFF
jgi:hypothetical protein